MKRKILIGIFVSIFLMGVWGTLTRKSPVEKIMGKVYITVGNDIEALKGHKISSYYKEKKSEYEYPKINDEAENLYKIDCSDNSGDNMKLTFSKSYYGDVLYNVLDSGFNQISENQTSINIPGEPGEIYYISVSVVWGKEKENVSMIYYFAVQT